MIRPTLHVACCLILAACSSFARTKDKPVERDNFDVVGHVAVEGGAVAHVVPTTHFSRNYLYAETTAGAVTVIDVTDAAHPRVLSSAKASGSLLMAAGDVALVTSDTSVITPATAAKTVSILDFSDKANPKVTREFAGVTSIGSDDRRGLVYLVNAEGLWILHRNLAFDPEVQERYAHDVVYNH